MTAASTMAASTGCGRFRSSPDANSTTISVKRAATSPESGVRAPALSLTSDCDMPPLTGNPRPSPATRLAGADGQELLIGVEPIAVLLPNMRPMADVSTAREDEAGERQRQERVQIAAAHRRQPEQRQALRHLAEQRHAVRIEVQTSGRHDAADHDEERHRPVLQPSLPATRTARAATPTSSDDRVRVAQVREEVRRALPEVAVRALEAEQLGQLRARQVQRQPRLEADEHGFGEEADALPARTSHAANAIAATIARRHAASAAWRAGSPPLSSPTDAPISSDNADVTVMTVCFELQKSQKTSPENRQA